MITWITKRVAIGEWLDATNRELLEKEQIDCILDLRMLPSIGEPILCDQLGIPYYHIQVGRFQGLEPIKIELRTASYMLELLTNKYKRILVHCTAGRDRAPFVVAYWMAMEKDEIDGIIGCRSGDFKFWVTEAYKLIKKKRPQVVEHMEWV